LIYATVIYERLAWRGTFFVSMPKLETRNHTAEYNGISGMTHGGFPTDKVMNFLSKWAENLFIAYENLFIPWCGVKSEIRNLEAKEAWKETDFANNAGMR